MREKEREGECLERRVKDTIREKERERDTS